MGKQHDTFPGEEQEMPVPGETPELRPPNDPQEPVIPQEDPQITPDEYPAENNPQEAPPRPGII